MILLPLFAAITPFILWPIELFLPYPHIIEELAKTFLVWMILKTPVNISPGWLTVSCGFLFAISESTLYLFNISQVGNTQTLITRLALTIPLHVLTILIIYFFYSKSKKLALIGVSLSVLIHFSYNLSINYLTLGK